jgi:hypothetical protein
MARRKHSAIAAGVLGLALLATGCLESLAGGSVFEPLSSKSRSASRIEVYAPVALYDEAGVRSRPAPRARYVLLPDVTISPTAKPKLERIANAFFQKTGKTLVVTSGTRGPKRQAQAMYDLLALGTDIVSLYKNSRAAEQLKKRYDEGRSAGKKEAAIVADMTSLIERQIAQGFFVSAHLRAGAVDVRNRGMSDADKRAFLAAVREVNGVSLLEEAKPPHFHLEIQ